MAYIEPEMGCTHMNGRITQPIETLRLSDRDKTKLLWALDEANKRDQGEEQRRLRVACTNNKEAVFSLKSEVPSAPQLNMLVRNLSRWGATLVHGRYIHPDSPCEILIHAENGTWHKQTGTVRHSRHIQGTIHEIGVEFDEPIDLSEFVRLTTEQETLYLQELAEDLPEAVDEEVMQLSSRVLIADDFASDRKLFGHWLAQAGLTVSTMVDGRSAKIQIQEQIYDLLVIDYRLGEDNGVEVIKELRQGQFTAPIIAISADDSEELKASAIEAGASRFLVKPFTEEELVNTAFELIGVDASADLSPIYSSYNDDMEMRPLLTEFTRGLATYIDELRDANSQNDFEALDRISHRLKGAGNGYGYPDITSNASDVLSALRMENPDLDNIKNVASELISTLNRVKLR